MQTLAIFYDAYRSLNAKRMFWITLLLSGLVVAAFAFVGINEHGLTVFFWQYDSEFLNTRSVTPGLFYKYLFVNFGIALWLGWIAAILALISTASIFPEMITSGSIDLMIAKPISRLRLFLTQYVAGLLFVTLQVTIFSLASFLVIGLRGGAWEPGLFLAVPLVVCLFSCLFSVCVFLGMVTRSTLAALLLTLLFWFGELTLGAIEQQLVILQTSRQLSAGQVDTQHESPGGDQPAMGQSEQASQLAPAPSMKTPDLHEKADDSSAIEAAHDVLYGIRTILPKTRETVSLLERFLISLAELPDRALGPTDRTANLMRRVGESIRARSVTWVVGTSLAFEFFVLGCAAFIFCRRDF